MRREYANLLAFAMMFAVSALTAGPSWGTVVLALFCGMHVPAADRVLSAQLRKRGKERVSESS